MKKYLFGILGLAFLTGMLVINSCQKDDILSDDEIQSSQDNARAEDAVADAFGIANNAGTYAGGKGVLVTCPNITVVTAIPLRLLADYGQGCTADDGKLRMGKIYFDLIKKWSDPTSQMTVTYDGYSADSVTLSGAVVITRSRVAADSATFRLTATNMKLTFKDKTVYSWTSDKTVTLKKITIGGVSVWGLHVLNGISTGIDRKGRSFTVTATNLTKKIACKWPVSGTIVHTLDGKSRTFDFGTGDCDNKMTVSKNGISFEVSLGK